MVPRTGLEPAPHCWDQALNLACLPISPPGQVEAKLSRGRGVSTRRLGGLGRGRSGRRGRRRRGNLFEPAGGALGGLLDLALRRLLRGRGLLLGRGRRGEQVLGVRLGRAAGQAEGQQHEGDRAAGRELGQEVPGAAGAEDRVARAGAERNADVRALAVLEQHDDDQDEAYGVVEGEEEKFHRPASALRSRERMMAEKLWGSRLAPPTRAPSMSGWPRSSAALSGFTEPPYWMRIRAALEPKRSASRARRKACASCAIAGVAVRPVPIAHTGS